MSAVGRPFPERGDHADIVAWHEHMRDTLMHLAREWKAGRGVAYYRMNSLETYVLAARWHNRIARSIRLRFLTRREPPAGTAHQLNLF